MASAPPADGRGDGSTINLMLTDDELRQVHARLHLHPERDAFGLVCRRWLAVAGGERRRLRVRAGPEMLRRLASRFHNLTDLDLSQSKSRSFYPGVTDSDLAVVADGFRGLRSLALSNCKGISDAGMQTVGQGLPLLQNLDVSSCRKLSDKGLASVAYGCRSLRVLNIADCKLASDILLNALSECCSHLEELDLCGCSNITDVGVSALADGCPRIKILNLSKCNKVGDSGICKLAEACSSSLLSLKLAECYNIGDASLYSLSNFCCNLETIVISGCRNVTDHSLLLLAAACGSLRSVRLDWCLNITDASVRGFLSSCKLVALDIGCCDQLTDSAFEVLCANSFRSELKMVKASNCIRITTVGVGYLIQHCEDLEYLDVRSCPQATKLMCEHAGLQFPQNCHVNFDGSLLESSNVLFDSFF